MILFKHKRILIGFALLATLAGAAFFRFENLGKQSYWMDEGYTVNAIISGMQNGTQDFSEILDSGDTYFCPMYCAPTKLIVKLFQNKSTAQLGIHQTELSSVPFRFLSALAGLLVVGLFFLIAKKTFKNNTIALLTAFFTAFSYWQIAWSRQARWYTLYELFFWLAMLFAYLATTDGRRPLPNPLPAGGEGAGTVVASPVRGRVAEGRERAAVFVVLSLASAALATLTHSLGYGLFVIIAIYIVIFKFVTPERTSGVQSALGVRPTKRDWIHSSECWPAFARMTKIILILAAIALPAFILEAATGFKFSHALINKVNFHYELAYYLNFYFKNYWYLIIFSLFGFFSATKEQKRAYWLVFLPILGYLAALGFLTDIVHYRYLFAPIGGLMITGAAGAVAAIKKITSIFRHPRATSGVQSALDGITNGQLTHPHPSLIIREGTEASSPSLIIREGRVSYWVVMAIIIIVFFLSGEGIFAPKTFYTLESDSNKNPNRPYWGYTPQPNFNAAYAYIEANLKPNDIVIASHPHFNKIFLNQPGYWIKYDYLGLDTVADTIKNNKEHYVGATVINNLDELKKLMSEHHGYITFDFMSQDNRISFDVLNYVSQNATQVFFDETNNFSKIWVYKF